MRDYYEEIKIEREAEKVLQTEFVYDVLAVTVALVKARNRIDDLERQLEQLKEKYADLQDS